MFVKHMSVSNFFKCMFVEHLRARTGAPLPTCLAILASLGALDGHPADLVRHLGALDGHFADLVGHLGANISQHRLKMSQRRPS